MQSSGMKVIVCDVQNSVLGQLLLRNTQSEADSILGAALQHNNQKLFIQTNLQM